MSSSPLAIGDLVPGRHYRYSELQHLGKLYHFCIEACPSQKFDQVDFESQDPKLDTHKWEVTFKNNEVQVLFKSDPGRTSHRFQVVNPAFDIIATERSEIGALTLQQLVEGNDYPWTKIKHLGPFARYDYRPIIQKLPEQGGLYTIGEERKGHTVLNLVLNLGLASARGIALDHGRTHFWPIIDVPDDALVRYGHPIGSMQLYRFQLRTDKPIKVGPLQLLDNASAMDVATVAEATTAADSPLTLEQLVGGQVYPFSKIKHLGPFARHDCVPIFHKLPEQGGEFVIGRDDSDLDSIVLTTATVPQHSRALRGHTHLWPILEVPDDAMFRVVSRDGTEEPQFFDVRAKKPFKVGPMERLDKAPLKFEQLVKNQEYPWSKIKQLGPFARFDYGSIVRTLPEQGGQFLLNQDGRHLTFLNIGLASDRAVARSEVAGCRKQTHFWPIVEVPDDASVRFQGVHVQRFYQFELRTTKPIKVGPLERLDRVDDDKTQQACPQAMDVVATVPVAAVNVAAATVTPLTREQFLASPEIPRTFQEIEHLGPFCHLDYAPLAENIPQNGGEYRYEHHLCMSFGHDDGGREMRATHCWPILSVGNPQSRVRIYKSAANTLHLDGGSGLVTFGPLERLGKMKSPTQQKTREELFPTEHDKKPWEEMKHLGPFCRYEQQARHGSSYLAEDLPEGGGEYSFRIYLRIGLASDREKMVRDGMTHCWPILDLQDSTSNMVERVDSTNGSFHIIGSGKVRVGPLERLDKAKDKVLTREQFLAGGSYNQRPLKEIEHLGPFYHYDHERFSEKMPEQGGEYGFVQFLRLGFESERDEMVRKGATHRWLIVSVNSSDGTVRVVNGITSSFHLMGTVGRVVVGPVEELTGKKTPQETQPTTTSLTWEEFVNKGATGVYKWSDVQHLGPFCHYDDEPFTEKMPKDGGKCSHVTFLRIGRAADREALMKKKGVTHRWPIIDINDHTRVVVPHGSIRATMQIMGDGSVTVGPMEDLMPTAPLTKLSDLASGKEYKASELAAFEFWRYDDEDVDFPIGGGKYEKSSYEEYFGLAEQEQDLQRTHSTAFCHKWRITLKPDTMVKFKMGCRQQFFAKEFGIGPRQMVIVDKDYKKKPLELSDLVDDRRYAFSDIKHLGPFFRFCNESLILGDAVTIEKGGKTDLSGTIRYFGRNEDTPDVESYFKYKWPVILKPDALVKFTKMATQKFYPDEQFEVGPRMKIGDVVAKEDQKKETLPLTFAQLFKDRKYRFDEVQHLGPFFRFGNTTCDLGGGITNEKGGKTSAGSYERFFGTASQTKTIDRLHKWPVILKPDALVTYSPNATQKFYAEDQFEVGPRMGINDEWIPASQVPTTAMDQVQAVPMDDGGADVAVASATTVTPLTIDTLVDGERYRWDEIKHLGPFFAACSSGTWQPKDGGIGWAYCFGMDVAERIVSSELGIGYHFKWSVLNVPNDTEIKFSKQEKRHRFTANSYAVQITFGPRSAIDDKVVVEPATATVDDDTFEIPRETRPPKAGLYLGQDLMKHSRWFVFTGPACNEETEITSDKPLSVSPGPARVPFINHESLRNNEWTSRRLVVFPDDELVHVDGVEPIWARCNRFKLMPTERASDTKHATTTKPEPFAFMAEHCQKVNISGRVMKRLFDGRVPETKRRRMFEALGEVEPVMKGFNPFK